MRPTENRLTLRVLQEFLNNLLVGHVVIVAFAVGFNYVADDRGYLVVSEELLAVSGPIDLRGAWGARGTLLGKHVAVDSPFYFGVPFMLNSITVVIHETASLDRDYLVRPATVSVGFADYKRVIGRLTVHLIQNLTQKSLTLKEEQRLGDGLTRRPNESCWHFRDRPNLR